ncbi:DNA-directed RNA polymerase I subunit (RPA49) [Vairimorpha necatrix]|uniref:DNA-directed RNA polymerase I subunit (RPA49) n=1 Tax=Vairimorpha necatrix TaxID=6039 RepID=A0AAX4JBG9_9MICR
MYILTNFNLKDKININFKEKDDSIYFIEQIDNIQINGTEKPMDCNFFIIESQDSDILNLENIQEAKIIECEVVYESGIKQEDYDRIDLIKTFGSKKDQDKLKVSQTDGYLKNPVKRFDNKSLILPKTQSSTNLLEAFNLLDMFSEDILESFKNLKIEDLELLEITKRFYDGSPSNKIKILLLDALLRLLNFKFVTEDVFEFSPYISLTPLFLNEIENRRLPKLFRDKIIIKIYILILQIENGKVKLASVPSFNQKIETVLDYFKILGCVYNKMTDEIKLVNRPIEVTTRFI